MSPGRPEAGLGSRLRIRPIDRRPSGKGRLSARHKIQSLGQSLSSSVTSWAMSFQFFQRLAAARVVMMRVTSMPRPITTA